MKQSIGGGGQKSPPPCEIGLNASQGVCSQAWVQELHDVLGIWEAYDYTTHKLGVILFVWKQG